MRTSLDFVESDTQQRASMMRMYALITQLKCQELTIVTPACSFGSQRRARVNKHGRSEFYARLVQPVARRKI